MFRKTKRLLFTLTSQAVSLVCYLLALVLLLGAVLTESSMVKQRLSKNLQKQFKVQVQYRKFKPNFFPLPGVQVHGVEVNGKEFKAEIKRVKVVPNLTALIQGKAEIGLLKLEEPRVELDLPSKENKDIDRKGFIPIGPGMDLKKLSLEFLLEVEKGKVVLKDLFSEKIELKDIQARADLGEKSRLELSCFSNYFKELTLDIRADFSQNLLEGSLDLLGCSGPFVPLKLSDKGDLQVTGVKFNTDLKFKAGKNFLQASFRGQIPELDLLRKKQKQRVQAKAVQGNVYWTKEEFSLDLKKLDLEEPELNLRAEIDRNFNSSELALKFEGLSVDIAGAKGAGLRIFGRHKVVREIFKVVNSGYLPKITVQTNGTEEKELVKNLRIDTKVEKGKVDIPKLGLELENVFSQVEVTGRLLKCEIIKASLGKSKAQDGRLELGLNSELRPFYLDVGIKGSLIQLPPILRRLVKEKEFLDKLQKIDLHKGQANGRLHLVKDPDQDKMNIEVQAKEFSLEAKYKGFPFEMALEGSNFLFKDEIIKIKNLKTEFAESRLRLEDFELDWKEELHILVKSGKSKLFLNSLYPWLKSKFAGLEKKTAFFSGATGTLHLNSLELSGPLHDWSKMDYKAQGNLDNLLLSSSKLPEDFFMQCGIFRLGAEKLELSTCRSAFMDCQAILHARIEDLFSSKPKGSLKISSASLGPESIHWLEKSLGLKKMFHLNSPVSIDDSVFKWGLGGQMGIDLTLRAKSGTKIELNLQKTPELMQVKSLKIEDQLSKARLGCKLEANSLQASFQGRLHPKSIESLFVHNKAFPGQANGDFSCSLAFKPFRLLDSQGELHILQLTPLLGGNFQGLELNRLDLKSKEDFLQIENSDFTWNGSGFKLKGKIGVKGKLNLFSLKLTGDRLDFDRLRKAFKDRDREASLDFDSWARGRLDFSLNELDYKGYSFKSVQGEMNLPKGEGFRLVLSNAELCGLDLGGKIRADQGGVQYNCTADGSDQGLGATLECFNSSKKFLSGKFDFKSKLNTQVPRKKKLMDNLKGAFEFNAKGGRIYRFNFLAKIFALLNSTEALFGEVPDLEEKGFGYKKILILGKLKDNYLKIEQGVVDGESMEIGFQGKVDLREKELDLIFLVSPLKTIDRLFKKIPVVSGLMGGNLISIPVRVSGTAGNPKVTPLSPTAVTFELKKIMKRALNITFNIFQPLFPEAQE